MTSSQGVPYTRSSTFNMVNSVIVKMTFDVKHVIKLGVAVDELVIL